MIDDLVLSEVWNNYFHNTYNVFSSVFGFSLQCHITIFCQHNVTPASRAAKHLVFFNLKFFDFQVFKGFLHILLYEVQTGKYDPKAHEKHPTLSYSMLSTTASITLTGYETETESKQYCVYYPVSDWQ